MENLIEFKNLVDIDKKLKDDRTCRAYYEQVRWGGKPVCPHCGSEKVYNLKPSKNQNEYKCGNSRCYKKFNALSGTIFENTKISLIVWFKAIHLVTNLSKGISSPNLAQLLGVTQTTAWFLIHRIREMLTSQAPILLEGIIEADETYYGGKESNKHLSKRTGVRGPHGDNKAPIVGVVERGGNMVCQPVKRVTLKSVIPIMVGAVKRESTIYTDQWGGYKRLKKKGYTHDSVNHKAEEYVRGLVHTGTIDGAWNLLKKKLNGIHHQVSHKHLFRYCNEFAFSYNNRKTKGYDRFNIALKNCEIRLLYKDLIAKA